MSSKSLAIVLLAAIGTSVMSNTVGTNAAGSRIGAVLS